MTQVLNDSLLPSEIILLIILNKNYYKTLDYIKLIDWPHLGLAYDKPFGICRKYRYEIEVQGNQPMSPGDGSAAWSGTDWCLQTKLRITETFTEIVFEGQNETPHLIAHHEYFRYPRLYIEDPKHHRCVAEIY